MNKEENHLIKEQDYKILVSESVGKGHPDKMCDQIADAILDACLKQDSNSRVACEVMAANTVIMVGGEITTKATVNVEQQIWNVIKPLGYTENSFTIICNINKQSADISKKVNKDDGRYAAGDQGITYGYATNETANYLPIQYDIANKLLMAIEDARISQKIMHIKADMKSQVELHQYKDHYVVHKIILAIQHEQFNSKKEQDVWKQSIKNLANEVLATYNLHATDNNIMVNDAGDFIIGGPIGDTGLTGRKLQVDTYGTEARHGGGALSGKDYTKVDRSGAYLARWIAKNVVYNKLADKCEIGLAWEIGKEVPDELIVNCFDTEKTSLQEIRELIVKNFGDLNINDIIKELDLKKPIYSKTSVYGHFGNNKLPWEKTFVFKK